MNRDSKSNVGFGLLGVAIPVRPPSSGLRVRPPSQISESGLRVGSPCQTAYRFGPPIRGGMLLGCESGGAGRPRLGLKQSPFHEPFIMLQSCASALYSFYIRDTYQASPP